jgi:hypothetical protein
VLRVFSVASLDQKTLEFALELGWPDFEDAVCAASATAAGCQFIVTRDLHGFRRSACPALSPEQALLAIRAPIPGD